MTDELRDFEIVEGEVIGADGPPDPAALGIDLPTDKDEAIRVLLEELHAARGEASSYLDDLRRVAADFDNFRKRATREQQVTVDRASERVLAAMLPVLDSFDAALQINPTTETEEKLLGGMRSTHSQLMDALAKEGLESVPSWGEPFDPEIHEAVLSNGEGSKLTVSHELRRGYRLRGKVLRAALVGLEASD
ncbi:MAG: nucleotide exchange factor GrpE [Acidimicrobiia bacterium]